MTSVGRDVCVNVALFVGLDVGAVTFVGLGVGIDVRFVGVKVRRVSVGCGLVSTANV